MKALYVLSAVLFVAPCQVFSGDVSGSERLLAYVKLMVSENHFDLKTVGRDFCTRMIDGESQRHGYSEFQSTHIGCGLPVKHVTVDVPSTSIATNIFVNVVASGDVCLTSNSFEKMFPGGSVVLMPDTGTPYYSYAVGQNIASATYRALANGGYCVSEINIRIKSKT